MARKFTLVLLLGSVVAVPAGADVMFFGCANSKTGRVRSIKTKPPKCRSIETRVSWNALGPKGNPGPPGPQGPAAGGVTVRDASEAVIGAWKPEPANAGQAVLTLSGHAVAIPVLPYGFYDSQTVRTYHESTDCSGPPLLRDALIADGGAPHPDFLFVFQGIDASGTAYYPRALRFSSLLGSYDLTGCAVCAPYNCSCAPLTTSSGCAAAGGSFTPPDRCCFPYTSPGTEVVGEVGTFDLATLGLVPPLHVEGP